MNYQSKKWIGVDFDRTLSHYNGVFVLNTVGEPIKPMCYQVRRWLEDGETVKIFTARVADRTEDELREVAKCINDFCLREFGQVLEITCRKDRWMKALYDDLAVQVIPNTGEIIDRDDYEFYKWCYNQMNSTEKTMLSSEWLRKQK